MDAITRPAVTIDRTGRHSSAPLDVRQISAEQHQAFVAGRPSVSFLQIPQWAAVKPDWTSESIGWFAVDGRTVGAALVLYRRIPKLNRSLAYLPEGPSIDWGAPDLSRWLEPLVEHLRSRGVFTVRMGPPVQRRWWEAPTIKSAIAGKAARLDDVAPDGVGVHGAAVSAQLREMGWNPAPGYEDDASEAASAGFSAGQPRYVFQVPIGGRSLTEIFAGLNQQWRRNIRTSERLDVEVVAAGRGDLDTFHEIYLATATRDGFTPRPRSYFPRMWDALHADLGRRATTEPDDWAALRELVATPPMGIDAVRDPDRFDQLSGLTELHHLGLSDRGAPGRGRGASGWRPAAGTSAPGPAGPAGPGGPGGPADQGRRAGQANPPGQPRQADPARQTAKGAPGAPGGDAVASDPGPGRPDMRLYLARYQGSVLAASILVRVGDHAWYSYGASADHDRRLKPSNALQWRMLSDSHAAGATVYDLRGIGGSLDETDALFGLTRFKLGSGGRAVEYLGEWELPLNRLLHRAVGAYLARR